MKTKVQQSDVDFMKRMYGENFTDPNFNADYNNKVIEETIAYNDKLKKKKIAMYAESLGERTDAVATYLKGLANGRVGTTDVEKYFGRKELANLRGQKIMQRVKRMTEIGPEIELIEVE